MPSLISTAPAMAILPSRLRPPPPAGGSSLVRSGSVLSSASISPDKGARCGSTIARRSLPTSIHAVRYEPRPSRRCSWRADRPLLWVAIRKAARNHVVSASLLSCRIVPARTEVWRPHSAHSKVWARVLRRHARTEPQTGHTKPSGQRCSIRYAAQASSVPKRAWNSISDVGYRSMAVLLTQHESRTSLRPGDHRVTLHLASPWSGA